MRELATACMSERMSRYHAQTGAVVETDAVLAQVVAGKRKPMAPKAVRAGLDPMFYKDLESFRKAVEDGTVDRDKGCRNMREYRWSVSHAAV